MILNEIIIFVAAYIAFLLSSICGGGAGLILIPILGNFLPIQFVPAALSVGTFTSSASRILVFFRHVRFDIVRWFVPPAIVAVWLGAWLIKYVNPLFMEVFIGLFLVSNLPFLFKKDVAFDDEIIPKRFNLAIIGFLAGFVSGITGAVGLLFNKFYLRCGMTKDQIVATRAANEILLHLIKLVLYASFGLISSKGTIIGLAIAFAALASTWSMKRVLSWVSEILFKKIGYLAMTVSGVLLLTQSTMGVFSANRGHISFLPLQKGVEAKLSWQKANFSLEFTFDDGFEIEQIIPITDLSVSQQEKIKKTGSEYGAEAIVVEAVYGFHRNSYEAYFYKGGRIAHKIEFY